MPHNQAVLIGFSGLMMASWIAFQINLWACKIRERPPTFNREWQAGTKDYLKFQNCNPISHPIPKSRFGYSNSKD
eukprot:scaffold4391_cov164-Ochromonas_danica.AAC.4